MALSDTSFPIHGPNFTPPNFLKRATARIPFLKFEITLSTAFVANSFIAITFLVLLMGAPHFFY